MKELSERATRVWVLALASGIPATQSSVTGSVAANEIVKASGTFNMLRELGGVFGIAIVVAVFVQL